jgi:hypothetical protein
MDVAVLQVKLGVFHRGFAGLHLGLVNRHRVLLGFQVELRNGSRIGDAVVHLQLRLGQIERRSALRKLGLCRIQLSLIGARIYGEKELAFFELGAVLKMPFGNPAGNLRRHGN